MVLMLQDGDEARFFVLEEDREDPPIFSLRPWPEGGGVDIEADGSATVPIAVVNAITRGIPLPRHGSMFGWTWGDAITSLIVIYTEYASARPLPRWAVMPLAGTPKSQWPPFTGQPFGQWFWEHYHAGSVVSLEDVIAETPGTIFWINTQASLGADSCAVAHDIKGPEGHILPRGSYVYSEVLRAGWTVPSVTAFLATTGKTDLTPRFRRPS
jgi:hypothetical protein